MTKTATFSDPTDTGFRWVVSTSQPTRIDTRDAGLSRHAAALARRFRRNGWTVIVLGDGPGASELRGA